MLKSRDFGANLAGIGGLLILSVIISMAIQLFYYWLIVTSE